MKKLMVVDLMNMAFRAYWGFAKNAYLTNKAGTPTFMCYGVAIALNRLLRDIGPDYVIIATDGGGHTFRHAMYKEYKSNRKESPDDFRSQLPDLFAMLAAYGFKVIKIPGTEADDIIGTIAARVKPEDDVHTFIVSGDKDFMQLVNPHTFLVRQAAEGYETFGPEVVTQKFGVRPDQVVDALAIIGDAIDVVPGVKGIGEKGAAKLIAAFGSLEKIYENLAYITPKMAEKLAKSKDIAFLSKKLVTIDKDVPLDFGLSDCAVPADGLRRQELIDFYTQIGFKSLVQDPDTGNVIPDKFLTTFGDM